MPPGAHTPPDGISLRMVAPALAPSGTIAQKPTVHCAGFGPVPAARPKVNTGSVALPPTLRLSAMQPVPLSAGAGKPGWPSSVMPSGSLSVSATPFCTWLE